MAVEERGQCEGEPWIKRLKRENAIEYGRKQGLTVAAAHAVTFPYWPLKIYINVCRFGGALISPHHLF